MRASRALLVIGTLAAPLLFTTGLRGQDSNTLNRHLEHQQWQRVQDHQNRSRTMKARDRDAARDARQAPSRACSADALPAADRRRMEAEYVRRARADGKASADAWVREQGKQFRLKLAAQGVCPDPAGRTRTARGAKSDTNDQGCQMVMRPVAGLGGAPMTMAMVPDCGDD
ncbi:MAG: hypothetical protein AB7E60_09105 [Sphingobium sp.]